MALAEAAVVAAVVPAVAHSIASPIVSFGICDRLHGLLRSQSVLHSLKGRSEAPYILSPVQWLAENFRYQGHTVTPTYFEPPRA